ncbi:MAG: RNA-guided pseudouridylation complex pseudouridine synthase subunit Cbf5 [Candidatus Aenigmarchaeota archaeon]|nr:RNA-guided pseudouridylation complex pseudouridine synthase subunit Cbf5 [Candidatus Aenigmarchaeota archaeon]
MLIKVEEISNPVFGTYPGARPVEELIKNGIVVLDKPSGPTSHQVASWVRDILELHKVGHSGTLDPKVTGVLVLALENASKIIPALMGLDKEYVALMYLHEDIEMKKLQEVVARFTGKIRQTPPKKSAVKRRERIREIYEIKILERDGRNVLMRIKCEKGTYIRKLIHDMGRKIGCGAHMRELRRVRVGPFKEDVAVTLQDLKDSYYLWKHEKDESIREYVKPVEFGIEHLKKIIVRDTAVDALCNGAPLAIGGIMKLDENIKPNDMIAILTGKGELIALGHSKMDSNSIFRMRKGIAAEVDRVIMKKGIYPRMWGKRKYK